MSIMNADELDSNVVGVAVMFYILADLENTIPRPLANLQSDWKLILFRINAFIKIFII